MRGVFWWSHLAALFLIVGVVLSPLRAVAETAPVVITSDTAVCLTATRRVETEPSPRPERSSAPEYVYDNVLGADGTAANLPVATGARAIQAIQAIQAYHGALELTERREDDLRRPAAPTAAEGVTPVARQISPYVGKGAAEINKIIGSSQRELLREFFGTGVEGAAQRAANFKVPQGLTRQTLEAYEELARRAINAGADKAGTQAARLRLLGQAYGVVP